MADVKYPGIPAISTQIPREVSTVLAPMREILQAFVGGNLPQRGILNGLSHIGFVDSGGNATVPPGAIPIDFSPPPAPTGLEAGGAIANVILSWDEVPATVRFRVAYTEIWRAETNDLSVAQLIGQSTANVYVDAIGAAAKRYYWIRYVSPAAVVPPITGPYNSQVGTLGETSTDPNVLIDLLVGAGNSGVFYKNEDPNLVINGVPVPIGVYMRDAYIANGTISNAKIGNAAIDNAKIANLDAGKITTGLLSADRIDVNSIKAAFGQFTEAQIGNASIGYAKLYGDMYSDNWASSGGSQGWYLSRAGDFYARNGNFTGDVHATNLYGNVVDTGNIKNRAVSDSVVQYNIWPGGNGSGDFNNGAHYVSQQVTLAYDSHCALYSRVESGAAHFYFDLSTSNPGSAAAVYDATYTANNVKMRSNGDQTDSQTRMAFLTAGTYYINSGVTTDSTSNAATVFCRLVFWKV